MDIFFCSQCGFRIKSGQEILVAEGIHHCTACTPSQSAGTATTRVTTGPHKNQNSEKKISVVAPTATAHDKNVARRRSGKIGPETGEDSSKMVMIGAGGAAVVVLGLVLLFSGTKPAATAAKNPETRTTENRRAETITAEVPDTILKAPVPPVTTVPDTTVVKPAPITTTPVAEIADIREEFAARKWKDILDAEKSGESGAKLKSKIEKFAESYATTKSGKEAREKLAALASGEPANVANPEVANTVPAVVPAVATTANTRDEPQKMAAGAPDGAIFFCDFDKDNGVVTLENGQRVTENTFGGSGTSIKSTPNGASPYFTSHINVKFKTAVIVKADTWIRFACYAENSRHIVLHTLFEPRVCEKYVKNVPQKKWFWVVIKASDYDKQLNGKGSGQPDLGAKFKSTMIYSCGPGSSIMIDQFSVGEGPVPTDK